MASQYPAVTLVYPRGLFHGLAIGGGQEWVKALAQQHLAVVG